MAKDMSFGKHSNNRTSMSQEAGFEISDLYQNEESIDLASYMTSANLELCDDDLFQSLFPSGHEGNDREGNVKIEKPDPFESELSDWWTEPGSAYSSACSSAAQSPVQYFNTPPVTPKSEGGNTVSPETIRQQAQRDHITQFSMSRTQLNPMFIAAEDQNSNGEEASTISVKQDPDSPHMNRVYIIKSEHEWNNNSVGKSVLPGLVKAQPTDPSHYEEGIYGKAKKRSLRAADEDSPPLKKSSKSVIKDSDEYRMKRERNNVAVRRSRDKAKIKAVETQHKVAQLSNENKRLHDRVAELTHELNTLKGVLKSLPQTARIPD